MTLAQPAKFLVVGAGGYVVNLLAFAGLRHLVPYAAAAVCSYLISNLLMFFGNRYWTFGKRGPGLVREYGRYFTVGLLVLASNVGVLALLVEVASMPELPAQAIALLVVTPVAFVANKRWTFT